MLNKADILKPRERRIVVVDVPEWGGSVTIRELTTSERSRFEASLTTKNKPDAAKTVLVRERLIAMSVIDTSTGELMFSDADIPSLSQQPARAMERVFDAIQALNGITGDDVADMEKNS